jgi:hypothetical protein
MKFGTVKDYGHGMPTSFIWIIILFDEAFKYSNSEKYQGYVGTYTELLCVELCNFEQYHIFIVCFP